MRITSRGQVTIPVEIREQAGLLSNTEVEFEYGGNTVRIVKVAAQTPLRHTVEPEANGSSGGYAAALPPR